MGVLASDSIQLASLKTVKDAATEAVSQAGIATAAASTALVQLSTVEDVVGTLAWISEHGTYKATTDTEKAAGKYYFARSEQYALTEDTAIDPEKTYYTRSGSGTEQDPYVYTVVANPDVQDIGTYYEMSYSYSPVAVPDGADPAALGLYELDSIDEAVSNYVASHLALTDEGLYVSSSSNGWRVLIASDGVYIINTAGTIVAQYKDTVRIGETGKHHIELSSTQMKFVNEDQDVVGEMGTHAGTVAYQVDDEIIFTGHPADEDAGGTSYGTFDVSLAHTPILSSTSTITVTLNLIYTQSGDARVAVNSVTISQADTEYEMLAAIYYPDIFWVNFYIQYVSADDVIRIRTNPTDGKVYSYYDTVDFEFVADYSYLGTGSEAPYYTFGTRQAGDNIGAYSVVAGYDNEASGAASFAEGEDNEATGNRAHAEGYGNLASGANSHAEGESTQATGEGSHAEGIGTLASGTLGNRAGHAEGINTRATGEGSHAEGYDTEASGPYSHAGGIGTLAIGSGQTAIGQYNAADPYALFIIGNGSADDNRSNAFSIEDSGNAELAGKLVAEGGLALGTAPKDTAPDFFLTLHESFANGGTVGWIAKTDMLSALGIENSATDKNGSSTNVSNNTDTTIGNTGALSAGTYILHAKCQFATNTTGYRMIYLATSNTGGFIDRYARVIEAPASGTYTEIDLTYLTTISSNTTFYVRVKHTANTTLSCVGGIQFIKIH